LEDIDYGRKFHIKRKIRGGKFQIVDVSQYLTYDEEEDDWISTENEQSIYDPNTNTQTYSNTDLDFGQASLELNTDVMPRPKYGAVEDNSNFFPLTGIRNWSETYDSVKNADKITSLAFSQMMAIYSIDYFLDFSRIINLRQEFILDGSVTGAPSNFITSEALSQGLEAAQSQP
jgi:hypothetical protein